MFFQVKNFKINFFSYQNDQSKIIFLKQIQIRTNIYLRAIFFISKLFKKIIINSKYIK